MKDPLFDHQKLGIDFLRMKKKAILADSPGLGKSRQAIIAAGDSEATGVLIICPASIKINWNREISMVYPDDDIDVVQSGPKRSLKRVPWIIINFEMLPKYKDQILALIKEGKIDTVIVDEAHAIKGRTAARAKNTLEIVKNAEKVYMLTGTPVLNRPVELFNLLRAIDHPLGKIRTSFVRRYCGGQQKVMVMDMQNQRRFFVAPEQYYSFNPPRYRKFFFTDDQGATHIDELKELTHGAMLRREKKEVSDLPPKIISKQYLDLTAEDRKKYDSAWEDYLSWIERNPDASRDVESIKSAQQLVEVGKLKQVCSLAKINRIVADIGNTIEQGEKVIVFSQYTQTISDISIALHQKEIGRVILIGGMSSEQKQESIDSFQNDPECKVFVANIKAGGVGVNLTAATIVMFADMDWSPEVNKQAEDRAHRIGQNGTVNVYYYICKDTVEEDIVKMLDEKSQLISHILEK